VTWTIQINLSFITRGIGINRKGKRIEFVGGMKLLRK